MLGAVKYARKYRSHRRNGAGIMDVNLITVTCILFKFFTKT
jgi:hypothetical protein